MDLEYYEELADSQYALLEDLERLREEIKNRHDPIEDIITNDEEDDGVYGYSVYDYWIDEQYCEFEAMMDWIKHEIYLDRINAPYEEAADKYYEEVEEAEAATRDAPHDPLSKLMLSIKVAEQFGCENDKSFAYEGLDILSQESADDHFGDGDPSQWDY